MLNLGRLFLLFLVIGYPYMGMAAQTYAYLPDAEEIKLRPEIRIDSGKTSLYSVRTDDLVKYLDNFVVFDSKDDFERLPYVIGFDNDSNMGAAGSIAYAQGLLRNNEEVSSYSLLDLGKEYIDPISGKKIGVEARIIGTAELKKPTTPQMILITNSIMQIDIGTRLIPQIGLDLPEILEVHATERPVSGYVIGVENAGVGVGSYAAVVLNVGFKDGIKQGDLLQLIENRKVVRDRVTDKDVQLPVEKFGEVIIYKVSSKISLAIIAYTTRAVTIGDRIISQLQ